VTFSFDCTIHCDIDRKRANGNAPIRELKIVIVAVKRLHRCGSILDKIYSVNKQRKIVSKSETSTKVVKRRAVSC
jgi:hypothetical protein